MVPAGWRKWTWESLIADLQANCDLDPATGCLLWRSGTDKDGYAKVYIDGRHWRASRALLKAKTGELHPVARHKCDTPRCLNDEHLLWGTYQDNVQDALERHRWPVGDRHHTRRSVGVMAGERNGRAKLSAADVAAIRSHGPRVPGTRPRGKTKALAERYGVSQSTIQAIMAGKGWAG